MPIELGKLRIISELSRVYNVPANPTWNNQYSFADILVGERYIYVMHMNFNYVSQYNKNSDGTLGSLVRSNSWYNYDTTLDNLSNNNSSVPYAYALYTENGADYLVGWSKSHNGLFKWRINESNNTPIERVYYSVAPTTMGAYSRGGWDGGQYVYFYNRIDNKIYRWDIKSKTTSLVVITKIMNDMSLTSSWTGSGMLVDTKAGEVYWGSGSNQTNGFLGGWSLATGQPLAGTPRNPIKSADLTSIGVTPINGEAGNITLTAAHRNIGYYFNSYNSTLVQLRLGWLVKWPENVHITKVNMIALAGEEITVSWDPAEYYEAYVGDRILLYKVEADYGDGWEVVGIDISAITYTYKIPAEKRYTENLKYRVFVFSDHSMEYENSPYTNNESFAIEILYTKLFLIKANNKNYTYQNDMWVEILSTVLTKDLFLSQGLVDLDLIPLAKWDELGSEVSLVAYTNSNESPIVDVTTQSSYEPIYLFNEKMMITESTVKGSSTNTAGMNLLRTAAPKRQLIFPTSDIKLYSPTLPEAVVQLNLNANQDEGTTLKVMFSVDEGVTYLSWDGLQWNSYSSIIDDEETKNLIESQGMTVSTLNGLTKEQLGDVFGYGPRNRTVRFVYLYDADKVTDILSSGELQINMDMYGSWRQAKDTEFTYGYPTNTVLHVQLFAPGSYKINGLLYGDELTTEPGGV